MVVVGYYFEKKRALATGKQCINRMHGVGSVYLFNHWWITVSTKKCTYKDIFIRILLDFKDYVFHVTIISVKQMRFFKLIFQVYPCAGQEWAPSFLRRWPRRCWTSTAGAAPTSSLRHSVCSARCGGIGLEIKLYYTHADRARFYGTLRK